MLFDPRPKTRREDLFGRDRELELLHSNVDSPVIVITGIRRIGKTSVLNVFLNEVPVPSVIVDLRELKTNYGLRDLYSVLAKSFSSRLDGFINLLKSISAVKIVGVEVEFRWRGRDAVSLSTLFDYLNRERVIVAFDEAQKLRGPRSRDVLNAIAHAYDYDKNITFIFTGSEVGLLYSFLGLENPQSPLYGRYMYGLTLERFPRDLSVEFLKQGFREAGVEIAADVIEAAVDAFDGILGWLTFFGNEYVRGLRNLSKIRGMAVEIALEELKNIVRERGKRYALALRGIAEGADSWGKLKRYIEEREGGVISPSILHNIIKTLEDLSIVKDYKFLDPVYRDAAKMLM
mgnify:CR=1 FL=1